MHPSQTTSPNQTQIVFAPSGENDESSFDFWGVLSRRKWLVFLGLVSGLAAGGLYNYQAPNVYQSKARVRIEPKEPMGVNIVGQDAYAETRSFEIRHDQLIGEYNIIENCLEKYKLGNCESLVGIADGLPKIREIQDGLSISQNREEKILYEIEYSSSVPEDAQSILEGLLNAYEQALKEQYKSDKVEIEGLITNMSIDMSEEYKQKKAELQKQRAETPQIILSPGGLNQYQLRIRDIQNAMPALKNQLSFLSKENESAQDAIEGGEEKAKDHVWLLVQENKIKPDDGDDALSENVQIRQFESRIFETESEIQRLLATGYGPGHRSVQSAQQSLADLKAKVQELQLQQEQGTIKRRPPAEILRLYIDRNQEQIVSLRENIKNNLEEMKELEFVASKTALNNQRIEDLENELARYRERAELAQSQLLEITSSNNDQNRQQGFYFTITERPQLGEKVWPILPVILGIGGLLGSILGFGLGCLVELADKTFHNPDQIIKQLQVPLIGHVPVIGQSKRYLVENSLIEPIVCTYHRPKSQVSEAFRAVRTALYFNTQGAKHAVIQVTSPTPGDGKSTLASNLAVSIAQSGKRVLLVDADMRRPRQHGTFGISSRVGFATVLSGQSEWRDTMFECEEIEGLTVMPCGAKPQNPAELSSSPQVKILIEEMRKEFDFVIIDTPPLLAVTDPCPIAARVDGVILCLRIKKNVRVSAERAVDLLNNLGANCIGLVVNGVGAQSGYGSQYTYGAYQAGYSYNGYGYGYGYGQGSGKYYEEDKEGRVAPPRRLEGQTTES